VISSIRTVVAFGGEEKEANRYESELMAAQYVSKKITITLAITAGVIYLLVFGISALAFWYIGYLVQTESASAGRSLIAFIAVLRAAFAFGGIVPGLQLISAAKGAAANVFETINLKPSIDSLSEKGVKLGNGIPGCITFRNVSFSYPARPDIEVIKK
jgi:ABC-type multidrug transport system fused ATPase/permease subunit